jgi:hypothetical protein
MKIEEFVQEFKTKNIKNTKIYPDAVGDFIRGNVKFTEYLPFKMKRELAEMIASQCTEEVDGIKKHDAIESYMRFVVAMIELHTDLTFGEEPVSDYDLLAEAGLLMPIIDMFKADYDECNTILGMALNAELEDNNIGVQVGKFLNGVLSKFDDIGNVLKNQVENLDLNTLLGGKFKEEDLVKLSSFLNKYQK